MTIRELAQAINAVPDNRMDEDVLMYIDGPISGMMEISHFEMDEGDGAIYNHISSFKVREVKK